MRQAIRDSEAISTSAPDEAGNQRDSAAIRRDIRRNQGRTGQRFLELLPNRWSESGGAIADEGELV